jgi:hypothetical protein
MRVSNSQVSDAAKRCSEQINLGVITGHVGKWVAIRLADGSSDGVFYDQRADAIEHQLHESLCCYVKIPPSGMPPEDAERFMQVNRAFYDAGFRLTDPDDERHPIMPHTNEEFIALMNASRRNR